MIATISFEVTPEEVSILKRHLGKPGDVRLNFCEKGSVDLLVESEYHAHLALYQRKECKWGVWDGGLVHDLGRV